MVDQKIEIAERVKRVQAQIAAACHKAGRDPKAVTLIAATKTRTDDMIRTAIAAGVPACGENRVQELLPHLETKAYAGAQIHFIGHLQTNKVRQVVGQVDMIHSVDSLRLAEAIEKQAAQLGIVQDVLLEVNIGREESKGGVLPEAVLALARAVKKLSHIRLRGLMCIPPAGRDLGENRAFFTQTRKLFVDTKGEIGDNDPDMDCLSMGMSDDFSVAIEEGATMVRVGTALFGARPPIQKQG